MLEAFPGAVPAVDATLYAGLAVTIEGADAAPAAVAAYVDGLPAGLAAAIRQAAPEWLWGPCTHCGAGVLVKRPPTPREPRDIGENDGPRCYVTRRHNAERALERCKGIHYPIGGPLPHPLAPPPAELPW